MENEPCPSPPGPLRPRRRLPRLSPVARRALIGAVASGAVLGGVLVLLPPERRAVPPSPGPMARTRTAVGAGVPVTLSRLEALIAEREARVRDRPGDARAWAVLGTAYVERGRRTARPVYYPRAEKALRTSLRVGPKGNVAAFEGLAALADARGDFREAREWAEKAVEKAPKRWTAYPALLDAYAGLGDDGAAARALDALLTLPPSPSVRALTARVYRDQGRREDAAAAAGDAAAAATAPAERALCLELVGELAWESGDLGRSLRFYEAALRATPDEPGALAGRARALAALGRTSEALRAYRAALGKRPEPAYALELGELYESLGLDREARVRYDLVRTRVPEASAQGVDDALVLGLFEADHGDPGTAVDVLRDAWERHPGVAVADALGWALHRAGDDREALTFATRATDEEHGGGVRSALYAYHRGRIERELGRSGPARRHLAEALRINPYFSPLLARSARRTLAELGEPSAEGPPG
ncbi:tetratricopeptide repeat protein [Streptomyces sp. NPDC008313]|uniref:tetratricopeptide repeat protein n=1 Tax=Streptomyces sp. NPDC008313 TaxID=3364826 RepID=UPI0036E69173